MNWLINKLTDLVLWCVLLIDFVWELFMLQWSIVFLIVAIIAAILGFGGITGTAADIARILFFVFLILFLIGLIAGRWRGE